MTPLLPPLSSLTKDYLPETNAVIQRALVLRLQILLSGDASLERRLVSLYWFSATMPSSPRSNRGPTPDTSRKRGQSTTNFQQQDARARLPGRMKSTCRPQSSCPHHPAGRALTLGTMLGLLFD
ncbi:unnamed protein product [Leuciscus chuanchicus]